jgi:hypothetical protein
MHRKPLMIESPILNLGVKSKSSIGQNCGLIANDLERVSLSDVLDGNVLSKVFH